MTSAYLNKVESIVPAALLERLFETFRNTADNSANDCLNPILDDPDLGPVARGIAMLWYCGAWTDLPDAWRVRNGTTAGDSTGVVSGAAYQAGLQWTVVDAHPAGARQQGFGAWSTKPVDVLG